MLKVKCLLLIGLIKLNGKLYIHRASKLLWAPAKGHCSTGYLSQVLVLGLGAYVAYTVPAVKELVFKYLKNNEAELMDLLDKNLSKAQMKAFEKLDETAQKHVKDSLVRNVLVTAWDEKDDELASLVKSKVKSALDEGKGL